MVSDSQHRKCYEQMRQECCSSQAASCVPRQKDMVLSRKDMVSRFFQSLQCWLGEWWSMMISTEFWMPGSLSKGLQVSSCEISQDPRRRVAWYNYNIRINIYIFTIRYPKKIIDVLSAFVTLTSGMLAAQAAPMIVAAVGDPVAFLSFVFCWFATNGCGLLNV